MEKTKSSTSPTTVLVIILVMLILVLSAIYMIDGNKQIPVKSYAPETTQ